jgi:hypothetical protein
MRRFLLSTGRSAFCLAWIPIQLLMKTTIAPRPPARSGSPFLSDPAGHTGTQFTIPAGPLVEMVEVEHPDAHLIFAFAILREVTATQLVWADRRGRWPWAADFDDGHGTQPVFGVRATKRPA